MSGLIAVKNAPQLSGSQLGPLFNRNLQKQYQGLDMDKKLYLLKQRGVTTHPCPNCNGSLTNGVKVGAWMSNYIPHNIMDVITYPWPNRG